MFTVFGVLVGIIILGFLLATAAQAVVWLFLVAFAIYAIVGGAKVIMEDKEKEKKKNE